MKEIDDDILKIEADLKKFSAECINWIKKLDIYFLAILIFLMILGIIFSITYNSYYIFITSLLSIPVFSYFYFFKKLNNPKVISADRFKKNIENYIQSSIASHFNEFEEELKGKYETLKGKLEDEYTKKINNYEVKKQELEQKYLKHELRNKLVEIDSGIKDSLSHYEIKIPPLILEEFMENIKMEREIKVTNLKNSYLDFYSKKIITQNDILKFVYESYFNSSLDTGIILKNDKNKKEYAIWILNHKSLRDMDTNESEILTIINERNTLDINVIIEEIKYFDKILPLISNHLNNLKDFNINTNLDASFRKSLLSNKKLLDKGINKFEFHFNSIELILIHSLSNYKIKSNLNVKEFNLLKNLFSYYLFKYYYSEFFTEYCHKNKDNTQFITLLWLILVRERDLNQYLMNYITQPESFVELIKNFQSDPDNKNFIDLFREEFQEGRIVLDRKELYRSHAHRIESRMGMLDLLFKSFGQIDYKYVFQTIFTKKITRNSLLRIISTQNIVKPYLLTFSRGGSPYISEIITENQKSDFYGQQYTNSARIGLIPERVKDLKKFSELFRERFLEIYFSKENKNFLVFKKNYKRFLDKNEINSKDLDKFKKKVNIVINNFKRLFDFYLVIKYFIPY